MAVGGEGRWRWDGRLKIRQGDIFWIDECPALDGGEEKRRPVVVVVPPVSRVGDMSVVVAVSSTVSPSDGTRIELPNRTEMPGTKSGLTRPCWVVPRWYLRVERGRLISANWCGYLTGAKLKEVVVAVLRVMEEEEASG